MSSSSQIMESWISSFCGLLGHEYFAEVSEDFIEDDFNLTGLSSQVPMYKEALEMILDVEPEEEEEDEEQPEDDEDEEELGEEQGIGYRRASERGHVRSNSDLNVIESSAELLYGLIHQRYITSRPGIQQMHEKYDLGHFGSCPRVFCNSSRVLPVGCSDTPCQETVKLYCPSCLDVYTPPNSRFQTVDGAFFGTTFGCLFFMTFPELQVGARGDDASPQEDKSFTALQLAEINGVTVTNMAPGLGAGNIYEPRIYGFRVAERAKSGPRMKWLRMKPDDLKELDECKRYHADDVDEESSEEAEEELQVTPPPQVDKRKKAPIRRRRRIPSDPAPPLEGGVG